MIINKLTASPKKIEYMLIGHRHRLNKIDVSKPPNAKKLINKACKEDKIIWGRCE